MQQQAFWRTERQGVAPQVGWATGLTHDAAQRAQAQQTASQLRAATGLTHDAATQSITAPGTAGQFMNPFLEHALAPQLAALQRQSQIQAQQQQADAVGRGAFGGSRDAIMRAERERNLLQQQNETIGRGLFDAFTQGQAQFNTEQARRLQAAGQLGQLGQTQFSQEMDIIGQRAQLANQMANLGQTQFGQEMDIAARQAEMGRMQQALGQRQLDQQFADFQAQRDFPYQQLGFVSDLLHGRGGSTRQVHTTPQPGGLQTLAGVGTALAGLGGMAAGGEVQRYSGGGITRLLSDKDVARRAASQVGTDAPMQQLAAQAELARREALRATAPAVVPTMGVAPAPRTLLEALEAGDFAQADGFAAGGEVDLQARLAAQAARDRARLIMAGQRAMRAGLEAGAAAADVGGWPVRAAVGWFDNVPGRALRAAGVGVPHIGSRLVPAGVDSSSLTPFTDLLRQERAVPAGGGITAPPSPSPALAPEMRSLPYPIGRGVEAQNQLPVVATLGAGLPQAQAQAQAQAQTPRAGLAALARHQPTGSARAALPSGGFDVDAFTAQLQEGQRAIDAAAQAAHADDVATFEAEQAARTPHGVAREARTQAELTALEDSRKKARSRALLQTGLAILAADPRRGAVSAIGQGALQGLEGYKAETAAIDQKRAALWDKLDQIDEVRRAEAAASGAERRALRQQGNRLQIEAAKAAQAIALEIGTKISFPMATQAMDHAFRATLQDREIAARAAQAQRIAAAQPGIAATKPTLTLTQAGMLAKAWTEAQKPENKHLVGGLVKRFGEGDEGYARFVADHVAKTRAAYAQGRFTGWDNAPITTE